MLETLLRPVAQGLLPRLQSELDMVPQPTDAPLFHAAGPDPDRVLVFGNGPAIGFGVRSQELALPGHLGRRLAGLTDRGVDVDLVARRGTPGEAAVQVLEQLRPARYDGTVITLGATDAAVLLPVGRWERAMTGLLDWLLQATSAGSPIAVVGINSLRRSRTSSGLLAAVVDAHARRLNAITRELCERDGRLSYVGLDGSSLEVAGEQSTAGFARLAEAIAPALTPGLNLMASLRTARAVRDGRQPELARQAAVERLAILDTEPEHRFDRIVSSARSSFGTAYAMITLLDGQRQWHKAVASAPTVDPLPPEVPREMSICDRAIGSDHALIIGDLANDSEIHPAVLALGARFYAGYPIESPDGYRIGSLCVLDTSPRDKDSVDTDTLRHLALLVQNELWTPGTDATKPGQGSSKQQADTGSTVHR